MSSISVTVFKDSVGFHLGGVTRILNEPVTSLGYGTAYQYDSDIDMVGCGSDEAQPGAVYLKVFTPETGVLWVNETEESLANKLYFCCGGSSTAGGVPPIVVSLNSDSPTYQNPLLVGADPQLYVDLGGVRIYPSFNPTTGTLDYSANGGFGAGQILTVIYNMPVGSSSLPVSWVHKTASATLTSSEYYVKADPSAGNIILTLPASSTKNIVVKRRDASGNTVTVNGNIEGTVNNNIGIASPQAYTFSFDPIDATYYII